jgi:hypothetical protein
LSRQFDVLSGQSYIKRERKKESLGKTNKCNILARTGFMSKIKGPDRKWNSRSGKKYYFLGEEWIFFVKLAFSVFIYEI